MSIRVNNNEVTLASQTGRAEQARPTSSGGNAGMIFGGTGEDRVHVSPEAATITSALAAQTASHAQRLRQLGALVAGGNYSVPAQDLSRAIVTTAIESTAAEVAG